MLKVHTLTKKQLDFMVNWIFFSDFPKCSFYSTNLRTDILGTKNDEKQTEILETILNQMIASFTTALH